MTNKEIELAERVSKVLGIPVEMVRVKNLNKIIEELLEVIESERTNGVGRTSN